MIVKGEAPSGDDSRADPLSSNIPFLRAMSCVNFPTEGTAPNTVCNKTTQEKKISFHIILQ